MAKKQSTAPKQKESNNPKGLGGVPKETEEKKPPIQPANKIKEIKVDKTSIPRIKGTKNVTFISNGLSRYMKVSGKVYRVTSSHAQLLIDKGYGFVQD